MLISLPRSDFGKAVKYADNQWNALRVFVTDGDLTIDNKLAENDVRPIALGRKNWMFLGHESGGQTVAVLSTLIASCRRHHVDPYAYLKTVIRRLTENSSADPAALLPDVVALNSTD